MIRGLDLESSRAAALALAPVERGLRAWGEVLRGERRPELAPRRRARAEIKPRTQWRAQRSRRTVHEGRGSTGCRLGERQARRCERRYRLPVGARRAMTCTCTGCAWCMVHGAWCMVHVHVHVLVDTRVHMSVATTPSRARRRRARGSQARGTTRKVAESPCCRADRRRPSPGLLRSHPPPARRRGRRGRRAGWAAIARCRPRAAAPAGCEASPTSRCCGALPLPPPPPAPAPLASPSPPPAGAGCRRWWGRWRRRCGRQAAGCHWSGCNDWPRLQRPSPPLARCPRSPP